MNQTQTKTELSDIFQRSFVGVAAGLLGFLVLGGVLLAFWSVLGDTLAPTQENLVNEYGEVVQNTHPLFLAIVIMAVFLASVTANSSYVFLSSILDDRYASLRATNLTQVFFGNIVLLLVFIPVYIVASNGYGAAGVAFVAGAQAVLSALFSFMAVEIISAFKSTLVSLYGVILGLAIFFLMMNLIGSSNPTIMSLVALPALLGSIGMGSGIASMFYEWTVASYGSEFLDPEKRYGADYGKAEKVDEDDDLTEWDI